MNGHRKYQQLPELLDAHPQCGRHRLWRDTLVLGFALDLLAVLIRASQEHDIKTLQAFIAGHGILLPRLCMNVRCAACHSDNNRGRDVECLVHAGLLSG
jgi:hypothetical protein